MRKYNVTAENLHATAVLLLLLFFIIANLAGCANTVKQHDKIRKIKEPGTTVVKYANPDALISAEELKKMLAAKEDIVILDARKADLYAAGHILGAVNIYRSDYTVIKKGFENMLPGLDAFARFMGKHGINNNKKVVLYGSYDAYRAWWTMHVYGFDARVLNGGIGAWEKAGYKLVKKVPEVNPVEFKPDESKFRLEFVVDAADIAKQINADSVIVDCRSYEEYTGEKIKAGNNRGGHIPGSVWIEWKQNLNKDLTFKSAAELEALYKKYGITTDTPVYLYCHDGIRSTVNYFALHELLGYRHVYFFDGSWIVWDKKMEYKVSAGT